MWTKAMFSAYQLIEDGQIIHGQNGRRFGDDPFKRICIYIELFRISLLLQPFTFKYQGLIFPWPYVLEQNVLYNYRKYPKRERYGLF